MVTPPIPAPVIAPVPPAGGPIFAGFPTRGPDSGDQDDDETKECLQDRELIQNLRDQWRELWQQHISWTRAVIFAVFDSLGGKSAYETRLLENAPDMANALRPFYGAGADELEVLLRAHITIAFDVLEAAKAGDIPAFNAAKALWYQNAHEIAAKMAQLNPRYWPFAEGDTMWVEHLDATLAEAIAHATGDYTAEVAAYDEVDRLAQEMADFFSEGIIQQLCGPECGICDAKQDYHDDWRELWEQHISWTRAVIFAVFDSLGGKSDYEARLLQNAPDMAALLRPFYGVGADEMELLLRGHITLALVMV